jgi:hypothetical protein
MTRTTPQTSSVASESDLAEALRACPSTTEPSQQREDLMTAIWATVCTRRNRTVVPMGSAAPVGISSEYASAELLAVMDWLRRHEDEARTLAPDQLYRTMRAVATLGMHGSGRAARADQLRGLTDVPAATAVRWAEIDEERTA